MNLKKRAGIVLILAVLNASVFAYNPPAVGESASAFLSPDQLGGSSSAAGSGLGAVLPGELAANPALGAGEQRIILDASYGALFGTEDDTGLGHFINMGGLYPTRWAVFGGSLNFLTSPFDTAPLGTAATMRASVSKDLTDRFWIGAGLSGSYGTGWGVSGDLGALLNLGDVSFMKDARIGGSVTGLGRPFTTDSQGIAGGNAGAYPSMFTPRVGYAATLFGNESLALGASADLAFPTFQNMVFDAAVQGVIKNLVTIRTGWNFNLQETMNDRPINLPSASVGVKLALDSPDKDSFLARHGWGRSEWTPTAAFRSLGYGVYATGTGVNMRLGMADTQPPEITVDYPEPVYISPNNDGTKDELLVPVSITDARYILGWAFVIENEKGEVVRTIANKEVRTEMQDIKSFWKLLTKVKAGIPLPENLRWDGIMDSGETAPDGTYFFHVTAIDDNDNQAATDKFTVYLDNTLPVVSAIPPSGGNAMIFSPDGDGNKDGFLVKQTGSVEDLWKAEVLNSAGMVVRTIDTRSAAPADFLWDGKSDSLSIVPDGVYSYRIATTDRAGNSANASVNNIIVDTEKPSINVSIDINAFSPNGDGVRDTVLLTPSIPVLTGLIGWDVSIVSRTGAEVRRYSGSGAAKPIPYDGLNAEGSPAAEADYQAVIRARYVNGHAPEARSPFFNLDVTAPESSVRSSLAIFSPVGDGKLDTVTFAQQASTEQAWTGAVFALDAEGNPAGKAVKTVQLGSSPAATLVWDGRDDAGKLAPDGRYGYRISSTDRAGNTGISNLAAVELNTEKADLILQASLAAFSPNGDGVKDSIAFTPVIKATTAVSAYALTVSDASGKTVKTFSGKGKVPASFLWNGIADPAEGETTGTRAADGIYRAALAVTLVNQQESRSQAPDFEIDTKFPTIEISAPYLLLSPNGDGKRDDLPVTQRSSDEELWTGAVLAKDKSQVRTWTWNGSAASFVWDAADNSGNRLPDGTYSYTVSSEDKAGNRTTQTLSGIVLDARVPKAFLTAELPAFSPNSDGIKDAQKFAVVTSVPDGLESWNLSIKQEGSASAVKTWSSADSAVLPASITWDGTDAAGNIAHGRYIAELVLAWTKGDRVSAATPAFLVNAKAPALGVRLAPKYFSPDNDGLEDELFINLTAESASEFADWSFEIREPAGTNGNVFWKTGGNGKIADRIIWDGRSLKGELVQAATDYPFTFTVKDDLGMTSVVRGYIPVDVMVIRDGDKLKIAVPSIIFRENAADFNGLASEVVDKNVQVLRRIAEILNKFKDYKVQVEGHANNVTGTQKEEDSELIPLSLQRADAVRTFLIQNGVDETRLSSIGMGGTRPVAKRNDRENWWKNRRVEFILIK
ncbi:OmpA family protein [Treponema zuelzerae]|uniref:OmpA family protein n=1 Tax=Teretinema zuelzerae TaxID=156 RepID=A0AAE3JKE1_9SPIR|nr:FlgD immunoglobulin-like domain containing protein [Teretinema zuelzerae]MCD1653864.1 OmpA family protein [Teretinema zuelzerae]